MFVPGIDDVDPVDMKKPSDDLFRLIRELSRSEQRYLRMFIAQNGEETQSLRLFDAIARQKKYDEAAIAESLKGDRLLKNLSYNKNYLYQQLLKGLRLYHADISPEARLHDLFRSVEILFEKRLFDQCAKLLEKGREMIARHNLYLMEFHLVHWENTLLRARMDLDRLEEYLDQRPGLEALDRYRNFLEFARLGQQMFIAIRRDTGVRDEGGMEPFENIMSDPLLQDESLARTFESRAHFHDLHAIYAGLQENDEEVYRHTHALVDHLEDHPERIAASPHNYAAALVNLARVCIEREGDREFDTLLKRLRSIPSRPDLTLSADARNNLELYVCSRADILQLSRAITRREFQEHADEAGAIEGRLAEIEERLDEPRRNDYWYNLAIFSFGLGDYDRALYWINRVLNESRLDIQADVISFARIFSLIIHIERGNLDLLGSGARSVRRFLASRERLYRFEEEFLKYLRKVEREVTPEDRRQNAAAFLEVVRQLREDRWERGAFHYFDVEAWLMRRGEIAER